MVTHRGLHLIIREAGEVVEACLAGGAGALPDQGGGSGWQIKPAEGAGLIRKRLECRAGVAWGERLERGPAASNAAHADVRVVPVDTHGAILERAAPASQT